MSDGDGDPFGTYRLRQVAVLFWPGVVGFAALAFYAAWTSVDVNREVGVPWWSNPVDTLVQPLLLAALAPFVMWWLTRRRRLVVAEHGVVIVGYFTRRVIPWGDIRRFDNALGLVVQTRTRTYPVAALEGATLSHLRGRHDRVDDLAGRLNRFILDRGGPAADHEPLSVDTAAGRSAARRTAVVITVTAVGAALLRLRYHV
ncbi:MAG TPA: hypothetical protein VHO27_03675 [Angustibacter sp.]|nr:hypothetical protein [Angustibacter sp.]